jgi:hypothetical protein
MLLFRLASLSELSLQCGGHPNAEVFVHHYELRYQNKKIHLEGSETKFTAQFGCISFHLSRFGNCASLLKPRGTNGLVVGIAIGSTARYFWSKARIFLRTIITKFSYVFLGVAVVPPPE